ncbi:MAG TPA: outer membrane beta-barrel protein [Candidatus Limnocylindrales bacterium]|jgi:hypothetical protein|nr:outer membrane beta-barrel protein [Candidatus Limnocylindrales bacterium]
MKKIVASVGLVALGASGIQTASAQVVGTPDNSKPWSVSATLRGFYDDNTATVPDNVPLAPGQKKQTFGYEIEPQAALVWSVEQTSVNLGFLYSLKYYENRPPGSADHIDQAFTFNAGLTHDFSERFKARVNDSFVIGQEPDMLRAGNAFATFQRVSGDNIRNYGSIGADAQIGPEFGIGAGYDNAYYDYKDTGETLLPSFDIQPSLAGMLNRIENRFHIEGLYQILPETKALIGYQFTDIDYNADEFIGGNVLDNLLFGTPLVKSDVRNSRQHTGYLGAIHNFSPDLSGSIRAGASYTDYYNDSAADNPITPYVNLSLRYTYLPQSYVEGGFSYDRNATDVVGLLALSGNGSVTLDAESAVVYATLNHRITPQLFGHVTAQYQNSKYNGGTADGKSDNFFLAGVELEYRFNQWIAAHAGYDFDRLDSDLPFRSFSRNRVYIGVTASY